MRSGWKRSNWSSFSPVEANRIGLPVTALHRQRGAAAGVAVELAHHHAVELHRSANCSATLTASWPVIASTTSSTSVGFDRVADAHELGHQLLVDVQAPAVSTISTSLPSVARALERPRGDLDRVALGALLVDRRAGLLAELHELLDRRRAVARRRPRARPSEPCSSRR